MTKIPIDISKLIVKKKAVEYDISEISMDGNTLKVLMSIDGTKNVAQLCKANQISDSHIRPILHKLSRLGFIGLYRSTTPTIDTRFFDYLSTEMAKAIGPVADMVIEDAVKKIGEKQERFPVSQVATLVSNLAKHIRDEEIRLGFQRSMLIKINEFTISTSKKGQTLDNSFFTKLTEEFARATGPIAKVVIDDEINNMGEHRSRFPADRVADLISCLERHIRFEDSKKAFLEAIKNLN